MKTSTTAKILSNALYLIGSVVIQLAVVWVILMGTPFFTVCVGTLVAIGIFELWCIADLVKAMKEMEN